MRPIQVYDPIIYDDFDSIFRWGISQAKDLSAIASNLSSIVQKSMPIAIQRKIHESGGSALQLNLYAPTTRTEEDYEVITINKAY